MELFSEYDRYAPILHVADRGGVSLAKELTDLLLESKGALVFLSDERFAASFSGEERKRLGRLVPWTRWIEEGPLLPLLRKKKDDYVIKAANGLQGQLVWLGMETTRNEWEKVIDRALQEGCWIVQKRIVMPQITFPYFLDGELVMEKARTMTLPFFFDNALGGFAVRTSIPGKSLKLTFPEHGNTGVTALFEVG